MRGRFAVSAAAGAGLAIAGAQMFGGLVAARSGEVTLGGFATSLRGRTASQRHNAQLSAQDLNGALVKPGAVFSFNQRVKSWTADEGYVKAPVSYDGELVRAYGGGVCQTSTTLYNAALLAGLPILERHSHVFVARYAPPGRDAAVAQPGIDLRFRNPYRWPIRIRALATGDRLDIRITGAEKPKTRVEMVTDLLEVTEPNRLTRHSTTGYPRAYVRSPGAEGCRAVTCRVFYQAGRELRRERLSDDTYQAMDRILQLPAD